MDSGEETIEIREETIEMREETIEMREETIEMREESLSSADSVSSSVVNESSVAEVTVSIQSVETPSQQRRDPRLMADDTLHIAVEAKDVIEYEWPVKSGEKWFLQEQIGELLDIKSFSRKFPDLSRRKVEKDERDWLCSVYSIHTIMNETQLRDLCAMRALEIHDLMASEYPGVYQEYQRVANERLKALMVEQAKEMEAIKNDSKRLAELREKALKSAAEYNKEMQLNKKFERKHFWDTQTSIIQTARNRYKVLPPHMTRVGPYPVSLLMGQYQTYYKKFTPEEMQKLPLGSVTDQERLFPPYREPSPPPIVVSEKETRVGPNTPKMIVETPSRNDSVRKSARPSARRVVYADSADDEDDM